MFFVPLKVGDILDSWGIAVHKELKGNVLFPIHWGTFNVAIHPWDEPVKQVLKFAGQDKVKLCLPRPGEMVIWPDMEINSRWWEKVHLLVLR